MTKDLSDAAARQADVKDRLRIIQNVKQAGVGGDNNHPGAGTNSIALGNGTVASALQGIALGDGASSTASNGIAIGTATEVDNNGSLALGRWSEAHDWHAAAIGDSAKALGFDSLAVGQKTIAGHDRSTALGFEAETSSDDQIMLGTAEHRVVVLGHLNIVAFTPTDTSDPDGAEGDISFDGSYFYWKTSGGWLRAAGSTF